MGAARPSLGVDDVALPPVTTALDDEAWRVREMALTVVARHRLDKVIDAAVSLEQYPVARVRAAASRAVRRLTDER